MIIPTELFSYARVAGTLYGTQNISLMLYTITRMHQPELVVEFGTGTGACSFLIAQALKENNKGKLHTFDSTDNWDTLAAKLEYVPQVELKGDYENFINTFSRQHELTEQLNFTSKSIPSYPDFDQPIDILISDFDHSPKTIIELLAHYLTAMAPASSIFIHGASTYLPTFLTLERIILQLNDGKIPELFNNGNTEKNETLSQLIHSRKFTLIHLTEVDSQHQNSTCWIKIEPVGIMPYPATYMF